MDQSRLGGRSAAWIELFFDLVVVVALAILAERLVNHPDLAGFTFVILYTAIWLLWTQFVLYANVVKSGLHVSVMLVGMAAVAVMAAAIPEIDDHANAFALAFVVSRLISGRSSMRTGQIVLSWPALQLGSSTALWVASLWIDTPWKYVLWAAALVFDLAVSILAGIDGNEQSEQAVVSLVRRMRERRERPGRGPEQGDPPNLTVASMRPEHLDERLSLFVIIVLGEAVDQVVRASAEQVWTLPFVLTASLGFVLVIGLWMLTFAYGYTASPHASLAGLSLRVSLPLHLVSTGAIVALAVALGEMVKDSAGNVAAPWRWIACGALATYFAATLLAALAAHADARWVGICGLPCVGAALLLGALARPLEAEWLVLCLTALVWWQVGYGRAIQRRRRAA